MERQRKQLVRILLCMFMILNIFPAVVNGQDTIEEKQFFAVDLNSENNLCIGPGDVITETISVRNLSNHVIQVRLHQVENIQNSLLFDAVGARWENDDSGVYHKLKYFSGEWMPIAAKETLQLKLQLYFPAELDNAYQGQDLSARLIFSCVGDNHQGEIEASAGSLPAPDTGDTNLIAEYTLLLLVGSLLLGRIAHERKK